MKKVVIKKEIIHLSDVDECTPIFAKRDGKLIGMVIYDVYNISGWALKIGRDLEATGHHETRESCLLSCMAYGYEFFVEE